MSAEGRSDSSGRSDSNGQVASASKGRSRKAAAKNRPPNADEMSPETLLPDVDVVKSNLQQTQLDENSRHARIAMRAHEIAEARGFEPGHELEDWLRAEQEIDASAGPQVAPENQFTG